MIKVKLRRVVGILGVIVLVAGGYLAWQLYKGNQMTNQYAADAQKLAQGSDTGSPSSNSQAPSSQSNSITPASPSTLPSSENYKQMMSSTYQQTLQAMKNVRGDSLALQGKTMSLSAYKASILQSQATFSSAEAFVRANPPTEEKLKTSYQEFLAGIILAKDSMGVVLKGISSLSPSNFYAAREMGRQAQQQIVDAYKHF